MKLIDESVLDQARHRKRCEICGKPSHDGLLDPAHIFSRGAGRVDIPGNVLAVHRACHTAQHYSGKPSKDEMLEIAAKREHTTPEAIKAEVYRIRKLPKDAC